MVKCLECGFEADRLQWTHFKFKCTGRFNNGVEYRKVYPNAELVDKELARNTAITLDNLIKKYGEIDGKLKWDEYKSKQAISNSYEYKREKFGWSREKFDDYNSSRAQTLEKMIMRHGEIDGAKRWEDYCLKQAYTNTKDYFIEKYGVEKGTEYYLTVNEKKAIPNNPLLLSDHLNISVDEATLIMMNRKSKHHYSNVELEFTVMLEDQLGFRLDHTSLKSPYGKWSHLLNTYVIYDICHKNCIIEFNGDYWHANPEIYIESALIRNSKAVDIWHRDMLKLKTATDSGFKVLTIWEQDFKRNKALTIEKVIQWMLSELE